MNAHFGLTKRQAQLLDFLLHYKSKVPPTFAEIAAAIGLKSKSRVHYLLRGLKERGYVDFLPRRAHSVALLMKPQSDPAAHSSVPPPS